MNNQEINKFIEEMGKKGDIWTEDQVRDAYGNMSLVDALSDRKTEFEKHMDTMKRIIKR